MQIIESKKPYNLDGIRMNGLVVGMGLQYEWARSGFRAFRIRQPGHLLGHVRGQDDENLGGFGTDHAPTPKSCIIAHEIAYFWFFSKLGGL